MVETIVEDIFIEDQILVDPDEMRETLATGEPEFLLNFFLQDELTFDVPMIHKISLKYLLNITVSRFALALPRNFAKTTLAKIATVWYYLFSPYRYAVYVSNTMQIAKDACRDIMNFMFTDNFRAVFGNINIIKQNESEGLYIFTIMLRKKNEEGVYINEEKYCILKALGANQQVRGLNIDNQRPELAVIDDLEDEENAGTPYLSNKLKRWFWGAFRKALSKKGYKIIWLGTMINNTCLLNDHCKSEYWHSLLFGCLLADGTSLWEEMFPLKDIMEEYREYQKNGQLAAWFAEMMNQPIPGNNTLINAEDIKYHSLFNPGDFEATFITIDPAAGSDQKTVRSAGLNDTAIVVHGVKAGVPCIAEYKVGKFDEFEMLQHAIQLAFKWNARVVGIESVLFSKVLITFFDYICKQQGIEGLEFVPLQAAGHKTARIQVWAAMIKAGTYLLPFGDFSIVNQLLHFDPTKQDNEDDLIDACAYGPQMLQHYMGLIMTSLGVVQQHAVVRQHQIGM